MRKVDLNLKEQSKYLTIKKLVETKGNKQRAAISLGCSVRHVNRMIKGYKQHGKSYFIHGNRGRKPTNAINEDTRQSVIDLYNIKYYDANFTHYSELLEENEEIYLSPSTVRSILMDKYILSPKARRSTKKKVSKHLEELKKSAKTKEEKTKITSTLIAVEDAHPRRPRSAYFGELIQLDASEHIWFGAEKTHLHLAIDDATNTIVGAYFDKQETLNGYYNVLKQILNEWGIPYKLFTDKRTVFEYKKKNTTLVENDTHTQFSYACKQLGIQLETSSVPQAKGRVERVFGTLQSRLIVELRLAGVTSVEQANEFLQSKYIEKINNRFALPTNTIKSVFETQPDDETINLTLAILTPRKIDNGHCIRFSNEYYKLIDNNGYPVYYHKGTSGLVIEAFDKQLFFCVGEKVYALDVVPKHARVSKNFDISPAEKKPKKRYIPPMSHPWKQASFERYVKRKALRQNRTA